MSMHYAVSAMYSKLLNQKNISLKTNLFLLSKYQNYDCITFTDRNVFDDSY